jgi:hypothetical protein
MEVIKNMMSSLGLKAQRQMQQIFLVFFSNNISNSKYMNVV